MPRRLPLICGLLCVLALTAGAQAKSPTPGGGRVEVVVLLRAPSLAEASGPSARAAARVYAEQRRFVRALRAAVPESTVRWRYRLVANGLAIVVPRTAVAALRSLPAVRDVVAGVRYEPALDKSPQHIGAPSLWAPGLENAGAGMKIAIIDDGVDQSHRFFDPSGYAMPPGYPRGQEAYTTAKVIVARAFPPAGATWKNAGKPFDQVHSEHGTHVAGIAAGNPDTPASENRRVSGVAPRAYIGNYKALTVPTPGVGLDGNAAEIVAAIEAAVADGMDVINLSIGEPEVEPSRDIVAMALDAAAELGVVPVVAAGNDYDQFGRGSVSSPGSSAKAITVAAVGIGAREDTVADFSSAGPTALSLRLKPDVSAPGVGILSSVPDGWAAISGTSMASPHVAGAAALLLERHPDWTTEQVKSALVGTADPARASTETQLTAPPVRSGSGVVDLPAADHPLVLASPSSVSFGLVRPGAASAATVTLADAGLGAGTWAVSVVTAHVPAGTGLTLPATVDVPGTLTLAPAVSVGAAQGDLTGWVTLTRDAEVRRIPFWLRVIRPALERASTTPLTRPGTYRGDTRGRPALVSRYRYPEVRAGWGVSSTLAGPEQLFRVTLRKPVANFGVVVTLLGKGVRVEPRVVSAGDENRLTGYAALPVNLNPYLDQFFQPVLAAGAVRPAPGSYDIVFDSPGTNGAGAFTFRYWLNDVTRPSASLLTRRVRAGTPVRVSVSDAGSGSRPGHTRRDLRRQRRTRRRSSAESPRSRRTAFVPAATFSGCRSPTTRSPATWRSVPPILPNTRVLRTTIVVTAP